MESVVYVYRSMQEAIAGSSDGATGFLVGVPDEEDPFMRWRFGGRIAHHLNNRTMRSYLRRDGMHFLYAVTAAHVVNQGGTVIRLNVPDAEAAPLNLPPDDWIVHPSSDVAVCPLGVDQQYPDDVSFIPIHYALAEDQLQFLGAGDDTFFVGRFRDLDGKERNVPTARFGNLAIRTVQPLYNEPYGKYEDSFVVEMRSLSGYSGSPVFTYTGNVSVEFSSSDIEDGVEAEFEPVEEVYLLGVDWCHMQDAHGIHTGMMGVVPAWKIVELLRTEEVTEAQQAAKRIFERDA